MVLFFGCTVDSRYIWYIQKLRGIIYNGYSEESCYHYLPLLHVFRFRASGVKVECELILHFHHFLAPSVSVSGTLRVLGILCTAHSCGAIRLRQRHPVNDPFAGLLLIPQTLRLFWNTKTTQTSGEWCKKMTSTYNIDDLIIKYV